MFEPCHLAPVVGSVPKRWPYSALSFIFEPMNCVSAHVPVFIGDVYVWYAPRTPGISAVFVGQAMPALIVVALAVPAGAVAVGAHSPAEAFQSPYPLPIVSSSVATTFV